MKCATCNKEMLTLMRSRLVCFDCQDKEIKAKGFMPRFSVCIRHAGLDRYLTSQGCPQCA